MSAYTQSVALVYKLNKRYGLDLDVDDAATLRRAALALNRWNELECGVEGANGWTICVVRDEDTGKTFKEYHGPRDTRREPTPDRETSALRRVKEVCAKYGLHYFHQGDPRGCPLYVSNNPIEDNSYPNATAVWDE